MRDARQSNQAPIGESRHRRYLSRRDRLWRVSPGSDGGRRSRAYVTERGLVKAEASAGFRARV